MPVPAISVPAGNRKVNQQRVQSADECHLQIQTVTTPALFPGIKSTERGSIR
jgi:hypothetical protein